MEVRIMNIRTLARTLGIATVLWCPALFPQEAEAQCTVSYNNTLTNDTYVYAEGSVADYYGSETCGGYGPYFFHDYSVLIQIACGTQYVEEDFTYRMEYGGGYVYGGSGVNVTETVVCDINISLIIFCSALWAPILEEYVQQQVPVLQYSFRNVSVTALTPNCPANTIGFDARVVYEVIDRTKSPPVVIARANMVPKEHVTVNGQAAFPGFQPFADPPETDAQGRFNDTPVGTCFGPPIPQGNPCVDVVQTFRLFQTPYASDHVIDTVTTRRDCAQGIRVEVSTGTTVTLGTVN
jgi:hypothetical protein